MARLRLSMIVTINRTIESRLIVKIIVTIIVMIVTIIVMIVTIIIKISRIEENVLRLIVQLIATINYDD